MPRIDVIGIQAGNRKHFNNELNYAARTDKCDGKHIGATNLFLPNKRKGLEEIVGRQMESIREFYGQVDRRLGIHAIFEFSDKESQYLTEEQALEIGYHIAETEF